MDKVYIIGVGAEGVESLSSKALELIDQAELLIGGDRLLDLFNYVNAEKIAIKDDLGKVLKAIKEKLRHKRIIVLASGDPGFYGISRYLIRHLGKDVIEIVPNVSSMQLAFARIKESWEDAAFLSLHARPLEALLPVVQNKDKICLFTDNINSPDAIGGFLLDKGIRDFKAFVCQELGAEGEAIFEGSLEQLSQEKFLPLNVLILLRDRSSSGIYSRETNKSDIADLVKSAASHAGFGIPDEEFYQVKFEKGLITKMEARAICLAKMGLREDSIVWDIGAGSGAVSIEASFLARRGKVYAIEKDEERLGIIERNIEKFSAGNVHPMKALAPEGLESLPDPDAIFIGGSGGKINDLLDICCQRVSQGGRIVVTIATLENLSLAMKKLEEKGLNTEVVLINVARSKKVKDLNRLEGMNPVFIITAQSPKKE